MTPPVIRGIVNALLLTLFGVAVGLAVVYGVLEVMGYE